MRALLRTAMLAAAGWIAVAAPTKASAAEGAAASAPADTAAGDTATRDALFRRSLKHPADVPLALRYAKACVAVRDYEGAIGALERVLYYMPDDKAIQAQLGLLYAQLSSHQMAKQYFDAATAGGGLDAAQGARVAAAAPASNDAVSGRRLFGTVQAGLAYQSNAAFNPNNNLLRLSGQDYVLSHPAYRGADGNGFQLAQIGYDYDLGNQRGDVVEARVAGYATEQFRFTGLDVGLYDVTVGPRFLLSPGSLPGWSIKPYAAGGQVFLAGQRYFASGGAGIIADLAVTPTLLLQPGAEVRRVSVSNATAFSSLNSGDTATASLSGTAVLKPWLSLVGRTFFTRESATFDYQSFNSIGEEVALVAQLPVRFSPRPWAVSPYLKLLQTRFDGANPFIDPGTRRFDNELQAGLVLETPLGERFDLVTSAQYAAVTSTIPNYRLRNVSVLSGPRVRF